MPPSTVRKLLAAFLVLLLVASCARATTASDNTAPSSAGNYAFSNEVPADASGFPNVAVADRTMKMARHASRYISAFAELPFESADDENLYSMARDAELLRQKEAKKTLMRDIPDLSLLQSTTPVSAMIWTIHFGLDNFATDSSERLRELISSTNSGIIGLLETDMNRLVNGNRDIVEYISYSLGYHYTDFGPTTLDSTFGCALISKYPIVSRQRIVMPSPVGELGCLIDATLDVYGVPVRVFVGHFGNTDHVQDRRLQAQQLGSLVAQRDVPTIFLGYLTTAPLKDNYPYMVRSVEPTDANREYAPGTKWHSALFKDTAWEMYSDKPWWEVFKKKSVAAAGDAETSSPDPEAEQRKTQKRLNENLIEAGQYSYPATASMDELPKVFAPDSSHPRRFFFPEAPRVSAAHPRWEFYDRYCQYVLYKPGGEAGSPYRWRLHDWERILDIRELSDTEIQVARFTFAPASATAVPRETPQWYPGGLQLPRKIALDKDDVKNSGH